jgi:hypothetical protein
MAMFGHQYDINPIKNMNYAKMYVSNQFIKTKSKKRPFLIFFLNIQYQ